MEKTEEFVSIKLQRKFVVWLKIEAAKAGVPMYEFLQARFPGVPKKFR